MKSSSRSSLQSLESLGFLSHLIPRPETLKASLKMGHYIGQLRSVQHLLKHQFQSHAKAKIVGRNMPETVWNWNVPRYAAAFQTCGTLLIFVENSPAEPTTIIQRSHTKKNDSLETEPCHQHTKMYWKAKWLWDNHRILQSLAIQSWQKPNGFGISSICQRSRSVSEVPTHLSASLAASQTGHLQVSTTPTYINLQFYRQKETILPLGGQVKDVISAPGCNDTDWVLDWHFLLSIAESAVPPACQKCISRLHSQIFNFVGFLLLVRKHLQQAGSWNSAETTGCVCLRIGYPKILGYLIIVCLINIHKYLAISFSAQHAQSQKPQRLIAAPLVAFQTALLPATRPAPAGAKPPRPRRYRWHQRRTLHSSSG